MAIKILTFICLPCLLFYFLFVHLLPFGLNFNMSQISDFQINELLIQTIAWVGLVSSNVVNGVESRLLVML